jgi:hypothetical protein
MMIEQRLPEACEEKVVGFHKFVLKLWSELMCYVPVDHNPKPMLLY